MKYTLRKASNIVTGNAIYIVECHNGLFFEGDNMWKALDNFMLYYGL